MKSNPAYLALEMEEIKKELHLLNKVFKKRDSKGNNFFLIPLPKSNEPFHIFGKKYECREAHLSVYERYKANGARGLSAFHYTWRGSLIEGATPTLITVHVYFSYAGRYLYYEAKQKSSKENISLCPIEEAIFRRHSRSESENTLGKLISYASRMHEKYQLEADKTLNKMETISRHLSTQLSHYTHHAKTCLQLLREKNKWSFSYHDSKENFLSSLVSSLELGIKGERKTNFHPGLYASSPQTKAPTKRRNKKKNRQKKPSSHAAAKKLTEEIPEGTTI